MAGKIQNEDVKSLSELTGAGGVASQLVNDTKIYVTANTINKQLSQAITDGDIGGGSGGINYFPFQIQKGATVTGVVTYLDSDSVTFQDTGDTVTLTSHGLSNGQRVSFTVITSTTGITVNTAYFVISATANTFQLSTTSGGSAIALTTNGTGTMVRDRPVDGTGGSPSSTIAVSTNSSLAGTTNLLWTKSANNRMGEGWSVDFTIDQGYQSKPFTFSMLYSIASGTFVTGDQTVWIYDVTNAVLIQPTSSSIENGTGALIQKCEFQASSNSTSYRLIVHTSTVSAIAYTTRQDSLAVGPNTYNVGAVATDWKQYTMTIGAVTTPPTKGTTSYDGAYWRRVGDSMEITYTLNQTGSGTAGSGQYLYPLPSGYTIDSTKLAGIGQGKAGAVIGSGWVSSNGTDQYTVEVFAYNTSNIALYTVYATGSSDPQGSAGIPLTGSSTRISFTARVPIAGWGTSQVLSNDTDTRVVSASVYNVGGSNYSYTTDTPLTFDGKRYDTHGSFNTSTYRYTVPVSGRYQCSLNYAKRAAGSGNDAYLAKNGVLVESVMNLDTISKGAYCIVDCVAGDILDFRMNLTATIYANAATFTRISGPSQIAASESVIAIYTNTVNATVSTSAPAQWNTKTKDTHGAVTTGSGWKFTAPISGTYEIKTNWYLASPAGTYTVYIYKNGTIYLTTGSIANNFANCGSVLVSMLAGDYIDVRTSSSVTAGADPQSSVCIYRVGSY